MSREWSARELALLMRSRLMSCGDRKPLLFLSENTSMTSLPPGFTYS